MAERPILFNGEMVKAVLAGKKTQTRRIIKPQPDEEGLSKRVYGPWTDTNGVSYRCPYGIPGDYLYVRERHTLTNHGDPVFMADFRDFKGYHWSSIASDPADVKWRPSIHHKREHCRILLEVVSVSVERVQDISEEDAAAEGVEVQREGYKDYRDHPHAVVPFKKSTRSFETLWDSINGNRIDAKTKKRLPYAWNDNPWVWVVEFRMLND